MEAVLSADIEMRQRKRTLFYSEDLRLPISTFQEHKEMITS